MFTGIVEERGRVRDARGRLTVECRTVAGDSDRGASIAVNGVCLTVVDRTDGALAFDVSAETRARSTLGDLREGETVNLERPLTLLSRLGGHLVQGHVDDVGTVRSMEDVGGTTVMQVAIPPQLRRYVTEKGSVAVDGVSLTVAAVTDEGFEVALVPHTLAATTLGERRPGDRVNVEADVLAKYVEALVRRSP